MSRHNRDGSGTDQRGFEYQVSFQPDWLRQVKVTRNLESGRQSTKTLFRNSTTPEHPPGSRIRSRVSCPSQQIDFEVMLNDPRGIVRRVIVETVAPGQNGEEGVIVFSLEEQRARSTDDE
jgi:hypothetical protein